MRYIVQIRLTSPCLGDEISEVGPELERRSIWRFNRAHGTDMHWELDANTWEFLIRESLAALHLDKELSHHSFQIPSPIMLPRLTLLKRQTGKKRHGTNIPIYKDHECINTNTIITIETHVYEEIPPEVRNQDKYRAPTIEDIRLVWTYIGKHLAISPWGRRFGNGRFTIEDIITA